MSGLSLFGTIKNVEQYVENLLLKCVSEKLRKVLLEFFDDWMLNYSDWPVRSTGGQRASINEVKAMVHAAYEHAITRPIVSHLSVAQCPLPIPLPFPSIIRNRIGQHSEILGTPVTGSSRGSLDVYSIPMAGRLRSSSSVLPFLENRLDDLRKFGIARGGPGAELLRSWGFTKDESEDMGEILSKMIMELNPCSQTSSDSD